MTRPDSTTRDSTTQPREQPGGWLSEVWYQIRIWTLALLALLVVAFMVSAILLAAFPHLAGSYRPLVKDDHPIERLDPTKQRERWPLDEGPANPNGRTPMDAYRNGATGPPTAEGAP